MKVAQNRAVPRHFADMTRSPCAELGHGSVHFGSLSPGAIFGVSFFTERRGGAAVLEPLMAVLPEGAFLLIW